MTNTEKTVPVPVELLQRLFDNTTLTRDVFAGDSVEVRPGAIGALIDIKSFLPDPPKVGDVAHADNWRDLPVGTVLRDKIGDLWLVGPERTLSYLNPRRAKPQTFVLTDPAWDEYAPVIISLPRD